MDDILSAVQAFERLADRVLRRITGGRCYPVVSSPLPEVDIWARRLRRFWRQRLDALGIELARGRRDRREQRSEPDAGTPSTGSQPSTKSEEAT